MPKVWIVQILSLIHILDQEKISQQAEQLLVFYFSHSSTLGIRRDVYKRQGRDWRKDPVPYPSFHLTTNNANIRRVKQRIDDLQTRGEFVG